MSNKLNYKKQRCLICKRYLKCIADYIVGGSHYYQFKCYNCNKEFNFSTYDFKLRDSNPRSDSTYDKFIDTFKHHFRK